MGCNPSGLAPLVDADTPQQPNNLVPVGVIPDPIPSRVIHPNVFPGKVAGREEFELSAGLTQDADAYEPGILWALLPSVLKLR